MADVVDKSSNERYKDQTIINVSAISSNVGNKNSNERDKDKIIINTLVQMTDFAHIKQIEQSDTTKYAIPDYPYLDTLRIIGLDKDRQKQIGDNIPTEMHANEASALKNGPLSIDVHEISTTFYADADGVRCWCLIGKGAVIVINRDNVDHKDLVRIRERNKCHEIKWPYGDPASAQCSELPQYVELANSHLYHCTRNVIARGDFSRTGGERWPTGHIVCDSLRADVQVKPDPATVEPYLAGEDLIGWQEKAADIALEMDDETADVLDYITYEVVNQAKNAEQDVTFSADQFYKLRGIQKQKAGDGHRGGYKTEYRKDFAREVEKLGNTWIRVAEMEVIEPDAKGKRRRSKKRGLESRAIVVSARAGQINLGGRIEPDSYRGRLGQLFAASVFGVWRQTAIVSTKALAYDPYRQLPEKRLTRYLSWQWRIRQGSGNYLQPYKVATLLDTAGLNISKKNPIQTKERLEKALETLVTDGIVSGWQYDKGWDENIIGKRGWAAQWQDWRVIVEPPQEILDHYKTIPVIEHKTTKALPANGETIGTRLQAALTGLGLTQLQAAEDIGINQATLSRVIRGRNPAPEILKKIVAWLDSLHSQKPNNQA